MQKYVQLSLIPSTSHQGAVTPTIAPPRCRWSPAWGATITSTTAPRRAATPPSSRRAHVEFACGTHRPVKKITLATHTHTTRTRTHHTHAHTHIRAWCWRRCARGCGGRCSGPYPGLSASIFGVLTVSHLRPEDFDKTPFFCLITREAAGFEITLFYKISFLNPNL